MLEGYHHIQIPKINTPKHCNVLISCFASILIQINVFENAFGNIVDVELTFLIEPYQCINLITKMRTVRYVSCSFRGKDYNLLFSLNHFLTASRCKPQKLNINHIKGDHNFKFYFLLSQFVQFYVYITLTELLVTA